MREEFDLLTHTANIRSKFGKEWEKNSWNGGSVGKHYGTAEPTFEHCSLEALLCITLPGPTRWTHRFSLSNWAWPGHSLIFCCFCWFYSLTCLDLFVVYMEMMSLPESFHLLTFFKAVNFWPGFWWSRSCWLGKGQDRVDQVDQVVLVAGSLLHAEWKVFAETFLGDWVRIRVSVGDSNFINGMVEALLEYHSKSKGEG